MSHLKSLNCRVAFRHCVFGRAPLCFTSDNQMNQAVAYCLQFSSLHSSSILPPPPPPPPWSAGQTRLDWNLDSSGGWTTSPLCGSTQSACQRVYLILLLLCVFAYLTAELPLTVLYLSLPLRKLLQYLWLLCNSERVSVRVSVWAIGSGTHLTEFFSCFT